MTVKYVDRNKLGKVKNVYSVEQYPGQESLPENHIDLAEIKAKVRKGQVIPPKNNKTPLEKLQEIGLTVDELKQLLDI